MRGRRNLEEGWHPSRRELCQNVPVDIPPETAPLVVGRDLVKSYGSFVALSGASFDIPHGITGLLGANGAGKTTLLGLFLGLHPRDSGQLTVFGVDPYRAGAEVRARLGYAPEHHTLPEDVMANDFVRHVAELHGLPKTEATSRASDALWLVGLGEERFRPMGAMSTGQRQRVKLAQAIAHDPTLIMLDEPTDGLDPMQRSDMLALIQRVSAEYGISVILSSHLLDEVEQICDYVVIVGEGRVLRQGAINDLRGYGSEVHIELDSRDGADRVAAGLAERSIEYRLKERSLVVVGSDDTVFDIARDVCADHEVGIERMGRRRLSLEDVFIEELG